MAPVVGNRVAELRAALEWTDAVTLIADDHVPDKTYESVRRQLSEQELVNLTLAVVAINGWTASRSASATPSEAISRKRYMHE